MARRKFSLQTRFLMGLAAFAIGMGIAFGAILYFHLRSVMIQEVSDKANLILAEADAIQDYVRRDLRPAMFDVLPPDKFIIKAMSSSYISRRVIQRLNVNPSHYYYRRVAVNARNPESMPRPIELRLIEYFRKHPDTKHWEGTETINGERYHLSARPVVYASSCMRCHGSPHDAPRELIQQYGNQRGFGYPVGQISGLVIAGFPVQSTINQLVDITFGYLIMYLTGMVFFFALISIYFNKLVVHNLHRLTGFFRQHFSDTKEISILDRLHNKDEIEGLLAGMQELIRHLFQARKQLEDYATNLENMVAERTSELRREADRHKTDVRLFVQILGGLNRSDTRRDMLHYAIGQIAQRFGAKRVDYFCTVVSHQIISWPEGNNPISMPADWQVIMSRDQVQQSGNRVCFPVKSQDCQWGLMCMQWERPLRIDRQTIDVLLAIGQQLGMALENIQAMRDLTIQKDMLQSVFESISDPLLMLDSRARVLMTNRSGYQYIIREDNDLLLLDRQWHKPLGIGPEGQGQENVVQTCFRLQRPWSKNIVMPDRRSFRVSLYPVSGYQDRHDCVVMYLRENTNEKQMLDRLRRAEKLSAVGQLAAGLAHEINNPLGTIQCYTDLLANQISDPQARADLGIIAKHTRLAQEVLDGLLNFARPKACVTEKCDLNTVIDNAVKVFNVQSAAKAISLEIDLYAQLPHIRGDANAIEQILTNLWLNAFDAVEASGGSITISTAPAPDGRHVILEVRDNGPGIRPEDLDRIFDPFFTTKKVGKGTGLGLAVVFGIVEELEGRIEVGNDQGAVFTVYFPIWDGTGDE